MKTFQEFIAEAYLIERGQSTFSSREELEQHYGGVPSGKYPNNRGSVENPIWRLKPIAGRKKEQQTRKDNLAIATGTQTDTERSRTERKKELARKRGKELHHNTELERSAKEFKGLTPKQIEAKKREDAKQGKYHGNDRRNLTLANPGTSRKSPGFSHSGYHAFERGNRKKLKDIEYILSPSRAYTTLVNKERKEKQTNDSNA